MIYIYIHTRNHWHMNSRHYPLGWIPAGWCGQTFSLKLLAEVVFLQDRREISQRADQKIYTENHFINVVYHYIMIDYPNKSYLSIWFDFLCCSCFLIFQHLQGLQRPEPPRSWKPLSLVRGKLDDESARININHFLFWGDSALSFTNPHVARCRWVALHIFWLL